MTDASLSWSFNPWRERPAAAAVALIATIATGVLVATLGSPPLQSVVLAALVGASLLPLLSPIHCVLDEAGAGRRGFLGTERRPWSEVRRVALVQGGILLSPFRREGRLDRFRAMLLPLPRGARALLLDQARPLLLRHGHAL